MKIIDITDLSTVRWGEILELVARFHDGWITGHDLSWIRSRPRPAAMCVAVGSGDKGALLGVAATCPTRFAGIVVVDRAARGRGIGTQLLRRCAELCPDAIFFADRADTHGIRALFSAGYVTVHLDSDDLLQFRPKGGAK